MKINLCDVKIYFIQKKEFKNENNLIFYLKNKINEKEKKDLNIIVCGYNFSTFYNCIFYFNYNFNNYFYKKRRFVNHFWRQNF
jgi:hypothetical protein